MILKSLVHGAAVLCVLGAMCISAVWFGTSDHGSDLNVFWGCFGTRYDVVMGSGELSVQRLHDFRGGDFSVRVLATPSETPEALARFKDLPWWNGSNSRWERVGYTVEHRTRGLGFEVASGTFRPPFVWQHRTVPFDIVVAPLWSCIAVLLVLPFTSIWMIASRNRTWSRHESGHFERKE